MAIKNKMFWTPNLSNEDYPDTHQYLYVKIWQPTGCRARSIERGTIIGAFCDIGAGVDIGERCLIQSSCLISNGVTIGEECFLGPGVIILNDKYMYGHLQAPVIGDRVHIGGGTIINPGVAIGADVFICSGALITKDVPAGIRVVPIYEDSGDGHRHIFIKGRVVW